MNFKEVISSFCLVILVHSCQCDPTATLDSLEQVGECDPAVFNLGSLAVVPGPNATISGTFEVLTELDESYRVALNFSRVVLEGKEFRKALISARSGVLCSAIGDFPWLLHDVKIVPHVAECPIPVGKYTVEGFQFDGERFTFYDKGNFEVTMQLFREDQRVCGAKVDMQLN